MQGHELVFYKFVVVAPFALAKVISRDVPSVMLGLAATAFGSAAVTFVAWMVMRVYIGRTGGSLGLLLNLKFSMPWLVISGLVGIISFGIFALKKRNRDASAN